MPIFDIAELVLLIALVTATIWAIGRRGEEVGDVFRTLFSNGPAHDAPRGVQEDDDAWEHTHRSGRDEVHGSGSSSAGPDLVDAAPPVPTSSVRR